MKISPRFLLNVALSVTAATALPNLRNSNSESPPWNSSSSRTTEEGKKDQKHSSHGARTLISYSNFFDPGFETEAPTQAPTTSGPTSSPTELPTSYPTSPPTQTPTSSPTSSPTVAPTDGAPTNGPTSSPTETPTSYPTSSPTKGPTSSPTSSPTVTPTDGAPTSGPTSSPTKTPTRSPTSSPTKGPTTSPIFSPTVPFTDGAPTNGPTSSPTETPTSYPTSTPTKGPTNSPTSSPTATPITPHGVNPRTSIYSNAPAVQTTTLSANPRKSIHSYRWGSDIDGCELDSPTVYLQCDYGGAISVETSSSVDCVRQSFDEVRCFRFASGTNAAVDFTCTGIAKEQLQATVKTAPPEAIECSLGAGDASNTVDKSVAFPSELTMASFHSLEWSYSGPALGCQWAVQPLVLRCTEGGTIYLQGDDVDFCQIREENTIVCSNPSEPSGEFKRASRYLSIWCFGEKQDELDLSTHLPSSEISCHDGGIMAHGISLGRACGNFGAANFGFHFDKSFCNDLQQFMEPSLDGEHATCVSGVSCDAADCNKLEIPHVGVASFLAAEDEEYCTYPLS